MFVAILVAMTLTGDFHNEITPGGFETREKCEAFVKTLDETVREDGSLPAFSTKCIEITKDDIKIGGKPV